jgi:uncharacterized protein YdcH (DUF465 family)
MVNMKKMHSLKHLLEISDYSKIVTKQTDFNPETGKISWDVSYTPNFEKIFKKIDSVIQDIQEAEKEAGISDEVINKGLMALRATKKAIKDRIESKYPEYLNQ